MTDSNARVGWNAWIDIMRGRFSLSRGFPTSGRIHGDEHKTYRVQVEQDGEFEQWSPKVVDELIDNMETLASGGGIDPPAFGESQPELPSNMCAMHNEEGTNVDGTEDIS